MFELKAVNLLAYVAWATVLLWVAGAYLTLRGLLSQPALAPASDADSLTASDAPLVSVLVPARNEAGRVLAASLSSMLAQDYGNFEIVAVNDRSTDGTGDILRAIARHDARLRVIEGAEPPAGWLGKPHAMQQALSAARGDWVLATDADMIFERAAVRTAMRHALDNRLDAVTLIPRVVCLSFWERVFMPVFGWFMVMAMPIDRVNDPARAESAGVGGFFLMRREALLGVGEYRAVRAEVAEDLRMAELLKRAGARLRIEYAPDLISTRMQTNLREIWEGFTKNLFAGAKFSLWKTAAGVLGVTLFAIAPPLVALACALILATGGGRGLALWPLLLPTFLVWLIEVALFAVVNWRWGIPVIYALAVPSGHALFVAILINSAIKIATGSGVTWKGRKLYQRAGGVKPPRADQANEYDQR